eukprot:TRINITY_DN69813_c0_g1_i1.p1 TRINITY_DN69813_c0_g1~~TRINITY_DN69813_c0_g1_i1.p1  ORF type:complete len:396 (+),score=71.20 TRINITY_DN69813_c0_g1_i1:63-1250(+)
MHSLSLLSVGVHCLAFSGYAHITDDTVLLQAQTTTTTAPKHLDSSRVTSPMLPDWWQFWDKQTKDSEAKMKYMTKLLDLPNHTEAYGNYMALQDENLTAWGMAESSVGKDMLRGHYDFVMKKFCPVLVTDIQVAVGNYAAERYHAIRMGQTVEGNPDCVNLSEGLEFDDCDEDASTGNARGSETWYPPAGGPYFVGLRGQTVYKYNASNGTFPTQFENSVLERWSNHDHGYRTAWTCNSTDVGDRIRMKYSGGFADDSVLEKKGTEFFDRMSALHLSTKERIAGVAQMFLSSATFHGVGEGDNQSLATFESYLLQLWSSFPDLIYHKNGDTTSAGFVAMNFQASGSFRGMNFYNMPPHKQPVKLFGAVMLKFTHNLFVEQAWVYDDLEKIVEKEW